MPLFVPPAPIVANPQELPHVLIGLALPVTGSLSASISSGLARINSISYAVNATPIAFIASSDNYVDLSAATGGYVVTAVAVSAASPALGANSLRLGYVRTNASAITSAVTSGKDSLNNWLRNYSRTPACVLFNEPTTQLFTAGVAGYVSFPSATELFDNDYMHVGSPNDSIITIQREGVYQIASGLNSIEGAGGLVALQVHRNGAFYGAINQDIRVPGASNFALVAGGAAALLAGDTLAMSFISINTNVSMDRASFSVVRVS